MLTTAHKNELNRYTDTNAVGVEVKAKDRMKICKDLVEAGKLRPVASHGGFTYFTKVK
jgi:hypothetical protein